MHVYACACTCAGRDLFIALLLLLAIFKWALGTTHFPVRAPGPRDRQKPGEEPHPFRGTSVSSAHPAVSRRKEGGWGRTHGWGEWVGRVEVFQICG